MRVIFKAVASSFSVESKERRGKNLRQTLDNQVKHQITYRLLCIFNDVCSSMFIKIAELLKEKVEKSDSRKW